MIPPKASIREIRINQNPFSPEYDKLGYGRIEIFTKPGSDKYRGTVDYNLGTKVWNARNPYAAQKAPFLLNEFEGGGGGPIGKRASFTVEAQRNMVDNGSISSGVTLDENLAVQRFSSVITTPQRLFLVNPRVDYQLNEKNTLTVRYGVTHAEIRDTGIGGFDLISRGRHTQYTNQTVQASETAAFGAMVNETRFQYYRSAIRITANSSDPAILVLGSFNGGGAPMGRSSDIQNNYELQNYTSLLRGAHQVRFGGRLRAQTDDNTAPQNFNGAYTFAGGDLAPVDPFSAQSPLAPISSIERYRRTLLFQRLGYPAAQIRALGGGATQFSLTTGMDRLSLSQVDIGLFAADDWRLRPSLTLSLGLRYETQTNIHDWRDVAPRIAIAWAPGLSGNKKSPKTAVRAGFGMFYDRFPLADTLTARRQNGIFQKRFVLSNPDSFPTVPSADALGGSGAAQVTQVVSSDLRAPYILQSALTVERQLPGNVTLAVTYTNSHGMHSLRSEDINAPAPGTFNPAVPGSGVFRFGGRNPIFLMESAGIYNQNQIIANTTVKLNTGVSLFGFYVLNKAMSNSDGVGTFPANPNDFSGEYGPASTDVRHRMTVGGSLSLRWAIRISPFLVMQSGAPFDITSGNDLYGTTIFNSRPAFATDPSKTGVIRTSYGLLDPNPGSNDRLVPRNFGRGPALVHFNVRFAKTIGFGTPRGEVGGFERRPGGAPLSGPAAGANAAGGGAMRAIIGSPSVSRRYNLTLSLSARNVLNHLNRGPIIGNITSPLFGEANQIFGTPNGEGFSETASNRRLEMQIRLSF
jgi:hypothetical protein